MAKGFAEADGLFADLPQQTRAKLGAMLGEFSFEISAAQKAALSAQTSGTGFLGRGIEAEVLIQQLRMRSGLLALQKGRRSNRYYGRFVEHGRRAQTVRVTRGTTASAKSASTRRRLKAGRTVRASYTLPVTAMAARPFVNLPDVEQRLDSRLAQFWSGVLGS